MKAADVEYRKEHITANALVLQNLPGGLHCCSDSSLLQTLPEEET